jgi:hypothetical protein
MDKPEIFGMVVLFVSVAIVLWALCKYEPKVDAWGDPLDSWEAEQRRRRASVYGYDECPQCGNHTLLDGRCDTCKLDSGNPKAKVGSPASSSK